MSFLVSSVYVAPYLRANHKSESKAEWKWTLFRLPVREINSMKFWSFRLSYFYHAHVWWIKRVVIHIVSSPALKLLYSQRMPSSEIATCQWQSAIFELVRTRNFQWSRRSNVDVRNIYVNARYYRPRAAHTFHIFRIVNLR